MTAAHHYYLLLLNLVLHGLHLVLIGFSLVGWMFCETRLLNLVALLLILFSWYGLGPILYKGTPWGYCVITDIQSRSPPPTGPTNPPRGLRAIHAVTPPSCGVH